MLVGLKQVELLGEIEWLVSRRNAPRGAFALDLIRPLGATAAHFSVVKSCATVPLLNRRLPPFPSRWSAATASAERPLPFLDPDAVVTL
jgi:hypothetical protein